ncbi:STAS domain-containing protein [Collimonas humicola]|uniref:STAS domain-containing protein n=1 Tax=Collimonas humicola TaxID=2825886 RepID=UPI001B8C7193|nr:STAS domain-containing protein [Collimonas humicola]
MGIFSLFGKNNRPGGTRPEDDKLPAAADNQAPVLFGESPERLINTTIARDGSVRSTTTMKIDAIESEMSSEFVHLPPSQKSLADSATTTPGLLGANTTQLTLPVMSRTTEYLDDQSRSGSIEVSVSDTPEVIEEAAVLFASDQSDIAEALLLSAISEDQLGSSTHIVWWMLLDLYQITGKQQEFDNLSVDFANKFETSPPTWIDIMTLDPQAKSQEKTGATPAVAFSGKLDANIGKQLERAQKLSVTHPAVRLEFTRVSSVDPIGCGLLLRMLKKLQKSGLDLVLVGADELADKIREILLVGRRDETAAPWLLLLEILHLLNLEQAYEDASIDYSITFEVSPPPFVAPHSKIITAAEETPVANTAGSNSLLMPILIEGRTEELLTKIQTHANSHSPAIMDCSRLVRVDFSAAGELLNGLAQLASNGNAIEFHNVNHLVTALFKVVGIQEIVRVVSRKN